jgi:hypothetical protein
MDFLPPFRSQAVRDSARDKPCTLQLRGICRGGTETTVLAHIRDRHKGMGQKASDHSAVYACFWCHTYLDTGHGTSPILSEAELAWSIVTALQVTWEIMIAEGVIKFPHDKPKERKVKARKPRDQRAPIRNNPARKIPSRPFPKRLPNV